MKSKMMMLLLTLVSWGAYAQHDHVGHEEKKMDQKIAMFNDKTLGTAYKYYAHVKDGCIGCLEPGRCKKAFNNYKRF